MKRGMKRLVWHRLSTLCGSFIAVLTLPLVLSPQVATLRAHRARATETNSCPFRFAEDAFVASVRDSVERLSQELRPLLVHTRNEVRPYR